jgi:predicted ATP-grasp superfamily ATP-dependent carboligase
MHERDIARRHGRVLVVGAEENPALAIIQSLARRGLEVHAASHQRVGLGFFSRHVSRRFLYPSPFQAEERFIDALCEYVRVHGIEVTLVAGEQPTFLLSKHRDRLLRHTRLPLVDLDRYMRCRDKTATMKAAAAIGVPTPRTWYPEEAGIEAVADRVPYPAVLKPNTSDGARGISYPRDREELLRAYAATRAEYGPCHVQERVPHSGTQYKAELLLDPAGEVKAACVYSKIRYYPPTGGSSTLNRTEKRPDILEAASRILKAIGWFGMGDCDFIEDPRDGIPKLMEINPRFTRSIQICVSAGIDFPYLLYRMAMGEEIPPSFDYRAGVYLRYLPADIMWFIRSPDRFRARPSFFRFLGRDLEYEIMSLKDLGPFLAYCLAMGISMLDRRQRLHRLR